MEKHAKPSSLSSLKSSSRRGIAQPPPPPTSTVLPTKPKSHPPPSHHVLMLAIDIGSSSTRCSVFEWENASSSNNTSSSEAASGANRGTPSLHNHNACGTSRKLRVIHPTSGRLYNVFTILEAVDDCVNETLEKLRAESLTNGSTFEIVAVGFSSLVMNLIGVDEQGQPLGDEATLSYACHVDAVADEVKAIKRELGDSGLKDIYQATGAPIHAAYAVAQLRVLYSDNFDVCQNVAQWQTLASCCLANWLGIAHVPMSYSEASWTGLLNYHTCDYEPDVLELLSDDCCQALPELADFDEPEFLQHGIPSENQLYYDKWPELRHTRFFLGVGDGACANIGSKCTIPTRISCTVGTSAAARVCLPLPIEIEPTNATATVTATTTTSSNTPSQDDTFVDGLFCYRIDKSHVLLGGALTDGGSVIDWVRQLLNLEHSPDAYEDCMSEVEELAEEDLVSRMNSHSTTNATSSSASSSSHAPPSLTFVPFLSGERSPGFRDAATGAMLGLTRATRPAHLFKACLEGVTVRMHTIVSLVLQAIHTNHDNVRIIASGKALESNALWRQMLADCTGVQVLFDEDTTESTSRGVACLISMAMGYTDGMTSKPNSLALEIIQPSKVSKPRPIMASYWKRTTLEQERLIQAVTPLYHDS